MIERDLLEDLLAAERLAAGNSPNASDLYRRARLEIERCHARLEIDRAYTLKGDDIEGFRIPWADRLTMPDGISCRDETIRILEGDRGRGGR